MKLVWGKSGDFIECIPLDMEFVEYWINSQQDFIWQTTSCCPQLDLINELNTLLLSVNKELVKVKIKLIDLPITGTDQNQLNELHRNWVLLFKAHPNIGNLFDEFFKTSMSRINKALHLLEESWKLQLNANHPPIKRKHPILSYFGQSNIKIKYENLGRSSYSKWLNFDNSVHTNDTNNFNEFHNMILLNLLRTFVEEPPQEYVTWCNKFSIIPNPNNIMIANFANLEENLNTYRTLFMKNFVLDNNDVIFTL